MRMLLSPRQCPVCLAADQHDPDCMLEGREHVRLGPETIDWHATLVLLWQANDAELWEQGYPDGTDWAVKNWAVKRIGRLRIAGVGDRAASAGTCTEKDGAMKLGGFNWDCFDGCGRGICLLYGCRDDRLLYGPGDHDQLRKSADLYRTKQRSAEPEKLSRRAFLTSTAALAIVAATMPAPAPRIWRAHAVFGLPKKNGKSQMINELHEWMVNYRVAVKRLDYFGVPLVKWTATSSARPSIAPDDYDRRMIFAMLK